MTGQRVVAKLSPDEYARAMERVATRTFNAWVEQGVFQQASHDNTLELTVRAAARLAMSMGPALKRYHQFQKATPWPVTFPLSEDVRAFQRVREVQATPNTRWRWGSVLAITVVLFAVSMLRLVDPRGVIITVVVLLFHELGHYVAMRLLRYKDTSIFFILFFGAATKGRKDDERIHEQIGVLLAGPVPGILLALAISFIPGAMQHEVARELRSMLVAINAINLLLIFPLDGGRIVQLLFGHARPMAEAIFKALGALAFVALGLVASDSVLLALGLLLFLSVPTARRVARAVKQIQHRGIVPTDEQGRLALVFSELRGNHPSLPPAQRYAVILPVAERLRHKRLSRLAFASWSVAYGLCVCMGLMALVKANDTPAEDRTPLACEDVDALVRDEKPGRGSVSLLCESRDSAKREAIRLTIEQFSALPAQHCLRAPWDDGDAVPSSARRKCTMICCYDSSVSSGGVVLRAS